MESKSETERTGLTLLKKGKKGLVHILFSRLGLIVVLLLLQVLVLFSVFQWFEEIIPYFYGGTALFSALVVLYLINSRQDPTAKITWLVVIMLLPVFGLLLFLWTESEFGHRVVKRRLDQLGRESADLLPRSNEAAARLAQVDPGAAALARYIRRTGPYPVYENTSVTYFPSGEEKWEELLRQLEQAKHFIFLEYFIIEEGIMWGRVLEILARKVKDGVDVRVMYDGTCEFSTLPHNYPQQLDELGIQCKMFAPVLPFVSTHYNFRDHRKIVVIDGHTAFTGGVNLADEYINRVEKYGHWKDAAVMLKGDAVPSFTLMFLQMWSVAEKEEDFRPFLSFPTCPPPQSRGYVLPFADRPLDDNKVGERVYMDLLNRAIHYVHIMSPYLILDGEMETAIKFAAERGAEVSIILPGIPDKKIPYALAKTHYLSLLDSGVHLYEYTPGFVHAKVFVADGREATVGTINLDYRSLYHHFECGVYLYDTDCISQIEEDFQRTCKKCRTVTYTTCRREKPSVKLTGFVAKAVAPLM